MHLGTNRMEVTAPKDRPWEAVASLRDIAEWLRSQGHHDVADEVDVAADTVADLYPDALQP